MDRPLELDMAHTPTTAVECEVLCANRPIPLRDFGDEAAAWVAEASGIDGCRLSGIGAGYDRTVQLNWKQGDAVPEPEAPMSLGDEAPYLLATKASLADLNGRLRQRGQPPVDMRRFRPNIVIDGLRPWEEDSIRRVRIGGVVFHAWQRCSRCAMTTIDRDSLKRGPEPLATLSTFRERAHGCRNFGMHLVPDGTLPDAGVDLSVGDAVEILELDPERRREWAKRHGGLLDRLGLLFGR